MVTIPDGIDPFLKSTDALCVGARQALSNAPRSTSSTPERASGAAGEWTHLSMSLEEWRQFLDSLTDTSKTLLEAHDEAQGYWFEHPDGDWKDQAQRFLDTEVQLFSIMIEVSHANRRGGLSRSPVLAPAVARLDETIRAMYAEMLPFASAPEAQLDWIEEMAVDAREEHRRGETKPL